MLKNVISLAGSDFFITFVLKLKTNNKHMVKIIFHYQVKVIFKDEWELRELIYDCDPNKTDRENLDEAFEKACNLGCDPNKDVSWKFVETCEKHKCFFQ